MSFGSDCHELEWEEKHGTWPNKWNLCHIYVLPKKYERNQPDGSTVMKPQKFHFEKVIPLTMYVIDLKLDTQVKLNMPYNYPLGP